MSTRRRTNYSFNEGLGFEKLCDDFISCRDDEDTPKKEFGFVVNSMRECRKNFNTQIKVKREKLKPSLQELNKLLKQQDTEKSRFDRRDANTCPAEHQQSSSSVASARGETTEATRRVCE